MRLDAVGTVIEAVADAWGRSRSTTYCECRRCGTTVADPDGECPHCEGTDVVQYELG